MNHRPVRNRYTRNAVPRVGLWLFLWLVLMPTLFSQEDRFMVSQEDRFLGWGDLLDGSFIRNLDRQILRNFRIPESLESERMVARARSLLEEKAYRSAVSLLQRVVVEYPDQVFQVAIDSFPGAAGCARFVGASEIAHYLLAHLPGPARMAYEAMIREQEEDRLAQGVRDRDWVALERIGENCSASEVGREALRLLAEYHLERGESEMAALYLKKILLYSEESASQAQARLAQALDQLGREEEKVQVLRRLDSSAGQNGLLQDLDENPSLGMTSISDWGACGGNNQRTGVMPLLFDPAGFTPQWHQTLLNDRLAAFDPSPFMQMSFSMGLLPFRLLRAGDLLIVNDSISARAFNLYTGERQWHYQGPLEQPDEEDRYYDLEDYRSSDFRTATTTISPHLIAGGTVAGELVLLNFMGRRPRRVARRLDRQVINKAIPRRGLFALSLETGEEVWSRGARAFGESDFMARISISSPPLVLGDRVLCNAYLREGGINTFVLCLDRKTGELIWKTSVGIGQQELTMFNMEYKEFATTPLTEVDGTLIFCSNLGFICSLDAMTGRIRWLTEYETIPLPEANQFRSTPQPREVVWANNPPLVQGDRAVFTPLDAREILALDWRTGKPVWKKKAFHLGDQLYPHLLGVHGDQVILSGENGAMALSLDSGVPRWKANLPSDRYVDGRGGLTREALYLPAQGELYRFDLKNGRSLGPGLSGFDENPVNLFLLGEVVALAGPETLTLCFDAGAMLAKALGRIEVDGGGVNELNFIGDIYRLLQDRIQSVVYYEKASRMAREQHKTSLPLLAKVEKNLFLARLDLGRFYQRTGRPAEAQKRFQDAFENEVEPDRMVESALALIDLHTETGEKEAVLELLSALQERCSDHRYRFTQRQGIGEAAVGFFVNFYLYHLATAKGDRLAEVAALQAIIENYPHEIFQGMEARHQAATLIEAHLSQHGREAYQRFDEKAKADFSEALEQDRVALLEGVARRYPNARVTGRVILEIARHYLDAGETDRVYPILTDFLQTHPEATDMPHLLFLMARAAEREGNRLLARELTARIGRRFQTVKVIGQASKTYGELFSEATEGISLLSAPPTLPRTDHLVRKMQFAAPQCGFIPPGDDPPPFMEGKVLLNLDNGMEMALFDYYEMHTLWSQDLSRLHDQGWEVMLKQVQVSEVITLVFESKVVAFDLRSGTLLWKFMTDGRVRDAEFSGGLLRVLHEYEGGGDESVSLLVMNPVSGGILWRKPVDCSPWATFVPCSDACVINSRDTSQLLLFDALTGKEQAPLEAGGDVFTGLPFRAPRGMILVFHDRESQGGQRGEKTRCLKAYQPDTGALRWSLPLDNWLVATKTCLLADQKLIIFARDWNRVRGQKALLTVNLEEGKIETVTTLGTETLLVPEGNAITGNRVFLTDGRVQRQFRLSAFDLGDGYLGDGYLGDGDFTFQDQRFGVGDANTWHAHVQKLHCTGDGLVIPFDFTLKGKEMQPLWSQVLVVDAQDGQLLYALDLYRDDRESPSPIFSERFPVEVALREDVVLVLKRSDLYVISGTRGGG